MDQNLSELPGLHSELPIGNKSPEQAFSCSFFHAFTKNKHYIIFLFVLLYVSIQNWTHLLTCTASQNLTKLWIKPCQTVHTHVQFFFQFRRATRLSTSLKHCVHMKNELRGKQLATSIHFTDPQLQTSLLLFSSVKALYTSGPSQLSYSQTSQFCSLSALTYPFHLCCSDFCS